MNGSLNYTTGRFVYKSQYTRFQPEPIVHIENGVMFVDYPSGISVRNNQNLVNSKSISLVLLDGELFKGGENTITIDSVAESSAQTTVKVKSQGGKPTLKIPSQLPVKKWKELFVRERSNNIVTNVSRLNESHIRVKLAENKTYSVQTAKVNINGQKFQSEVEYITTENKKVSVQAGESTTVSAQVRDRYNNPKVGVTTNASANSGSITPKQEDTDSNGISSFKYTAPSSPGSDTINISIPDRSGEKAYVNINVNVTENVAVGGGNGSQDDVGSGGSTNWSESDNTTSLTSSGGAWKNIGKVRNITLSQPVFSVLEPSSDLAVTDRRFAKYVITITNGTTSYYLVVGAQPKGGSGGQPGRGGNTDGFKLKVPENNWESREMSLYKDNNSSAIAYFEAENMKVSELDKWYSRTDPLEVLEPTEYENPNIVRSGLNDMRDFLYNESVTMYFEEVHGRATITVD